MYPPITYELLKSKKSCARELALVKEHFGLESIPLTDEVIEKFSSIFDIEWAASNLLTQVDFLEYVRVNDLALTEYNKVTELAFAEYNKVVDPAFAEYNKVSGPAWSEYNRVTEPARAEYNKVVAKEFVLLYQKGM